MSSQAYPHQSNFTDHTHSFKIDLIKEAIRKGVKRAFDFTLALLGLILLIPIFVYISILIKRDSPGPVFFWGTRMGKDGKPFKILKFRTMYERRESYQGPPVTGDKDQRITPLGHWLRDTKINELPQLWNVLIGEMSIVGPRPEDVEIAKSWPPDAFEEILSIRPGITSPTSVLYHDEEKLLSQDNLMRDYLKRILPDKIRLDRLYVRHHSFFSDLDAVFWTIAIIIPKLSKAQIPEAYLFAGPISRIIHRYVNWFLIDFLVSFIVAYTASFIWQIGQQVPLDLDDLGATALLLALFFSGFNSVIGLNRVLWSKATVDDAVHLTMSSVLITVVLCIFNSLQSIYHWFSLSGLPTSMILFVGMTAGFGFLSVRYRLRLLSSTARRWVNWRQQTSKIGEQVLIVGLGEGNKIANYLLRQNIFRTAFSIVGTIDNTNPSQHGMRVSGNWILGGIRDIPALIKRHDIGMILSTIPRPEPENEYILEICQISHTRLIFLDDLLSMTNRQVTRPRGQIDSQLWVEGNLEYKAMHDVVTGLPNRSLLQDRVQHSLRYAKRYGTQSALIFIEFNAMKKVDETLGHTISSEVLKNLSEGVKKCKRDSDTLAWFGFDTFALLLENLPSEREIEIVIERIRSTLSNPFHIAHHEFLLDPRIGHCLCQPAYDAFENPEKLDLIQCYGFAMAKSKTNETEALKAYDNILAK
jgi:diguanylate cyclase (GGDEF)-like protein